MLSITTPALAAVDYGQTATDVFATAGVVGAILFVGGVVGVWIWYLASLTDTDKTGEPEPMSRTARRVATTLTAVVALMTLGLSGLTLQQMLQHQAEDQQVRVAITQKYGIPVGHDQEIPNEGWTDEVLGRVNGKVMKCDLSRSGGEPFIFCAQGKEGSRKVEADRG